MKINEFVQYNNSSKKFTVFYTEETIPNLPLKGLMAVIDDKRYLITIDIEYDKCFAIDDLITPENMYVEFVNE